MPIEPHTLEQIQSWMQNVIVHPHGVEAGIESDAAISHIPATPESVESVISRSLSLTSLERLAIYANAYYARLLECLREDFPAMTHALGEETFNAFAFAYLQEYPSASYTLADLSRDFPRFLAETRPVDEEGDGSSAGWPEFLIDLARLERTSVEIFDGPGIENSRTLQSENLAGITPEQWPTARLIPAPCLRLLSLRFPVHEYLTAVRREESPTMPQPVPTYLILTRKDYLIHRLSVSRLEFDLLSRLVAGETIGTAIAAIADDPDADPDRLPADLEDWFRGWASLQIFERIKLGDGAT